MKLLLLGTTGYHPNERRQTSCFILPEIGVVLDAGTAMFRVREHLATDTLDIFITHAHLDHVVGLTYLLDVLHGRQMERVTLHGDAVKLASVEEHLFAEALFPVTPNFTLAPLASETPLGGGGVLTHFPLKHPGGSLGFRLDWPGRSMAYVTDTTAKPGADYLEKIRGVDLLLHECNFPDGYEELAEVTGHTCTSAAAAAAAEAGVGRLILTHALPMSSAQDPLDVPAAQEIFPATEIAEDGMEVEF